MSFIKKAALVATSSLLTGCGSILPSHLHDDTRAQSTSKLADLLSTYGNNSPNIYDTMLKSSQEIADQQDKVFAALLSNNTTARAQQYPFLDGKDLETNRKTVKDTISATQEELRQDIDTYRKQNDAANQASASADTALAAIKSDITNVQNDVDNWNKTVALLEQGIADIPAEGSGSQDTKAMGLSALKDRLSAVDNQPVSYVDAAGKKQTATVQEIVISQVNLTKGAPSFKIPDAPGATLTILTLGSNLANIQKQNANATLAILQQRLEVYERVNSELNLADCLIKDLDGIDVWLPKEGTSLALDIPRLVYSARASQDDALKQATIPQKETRDAQLMREKQLATDVHQMNIYTLDAAGELVAVRQLATAQNIIKRTQLDLRIETARLTHSESIMKSKINDVAWQSTLSAGITVLNQYEQGGFTSQDASTIIGIAQTVAVGVIAGRVH